MDYELIVKLSAATRILRPARVQELNARIAELRTTLGLEKHQATNLVDAIDQVARLETLVALAAGIGDDDEKPSAGNAPSPRPQTNEFPLHAQLAALPRGERTKFARANESGLRVEAARLTASPVVKSFKI